MKIIRKTLQANHENHVWFQVAEKAASRYRGGHDLAGAAEEPTSAPSMANLTLHNSCSFPV
jgi:hypothetical protein